MLTAAALFIACLIPLIFLLIVYKLDLYKTGNFRNILICLVWGVVAYEIAAQLNPWMRDQGLISSDTLVHFSAPILEELLKGLVLMFLIRRANFTYFVDGAIYGFAAGIGFAIFENFEYILGNPEAALGLSIARVLSTNLVHATGSGLIGIAFGMARFDRSWSWRRVVVPLGGALLAMTLHMGFNAIVNSHTDLILVYAIAVGFGGALIIGGIMRFGLKEEKIWIMEKLGDADRVTVQEKSAVEGLDKLNKLLAPLAERFGSEKANQVKDFLTLQARLGILRKTVEKLGDEKMRHTVEVQVETLSAEMDQARRKVGTYCMLYLRNTFLDESGSIYNRLEGILQERANAGGEQGGGKAWMQAFGSKFEPQPPKNE